MFTTKEVTGPEQLCDFMAEYKDKQLEMNKYSKGLRNITKSIGCDIYTISEDHLGLAEPLLKAGDADIIRQNAMRGSEGQVYAIYVPAEAKHMLFGLGGGAIITQIVISLFLKG